MDRTTTTTACRLAQRSLSSSSLLSSSSPSLSLPYELVIVESPTKCSTIDRILNDYALQQEQEQQQQQQQQQEQQQQDLARQGRKNNADFDFGSTASYRQALMPLQQQAQQGPAQTHRRAQRPTKQPRRSSSNAQL